MGSVDKVKETLGKCGFESMMINNTIRGNLISEFSNIKKKKTLLNKLAGKLKKIKKSVQ